MDNELHKQLNTNVGEKKLYTLARQLGPCWEGCAAGQGDSRKRWKCTDK